MSKVSIEIEATGQVEVGRQISESVGKITQATAGMGNIIQKAKQHFQTVTQAYNQQGQAKIQQDQKEEEFSQKRLERIKAEVGARKKMIAALEKEEPEGEKKSAMRDIMLAKEKSHLESLELESTVKKMAPESSKIPGFLKGKVMRYGGAIAGMMGAFSLFSKISGGLSEATQQNDILADAMLTMPEGGRAGGYSAAKSNVFEKSIKSLGEAALISSKDMANMVAAMLEVGTVSEEEAKKQAKIANEARSMAVDPAVAGKIEVELMRAGVLTKGIAGSEQYLEYQKKMAGTPGMSNRMEEMMQAFSETMLAVTHGPTGAKGGGIILDLLNRFNTSNMPMYKGTRGGQLLRDIDQAFRSGGNETFELFQYQALSPLAQGRNRMLDKSFVGQKSGKMGSGMYDAVFADLAQSFGAFATPKTMVAKLESMKGMEDVANYLKEKFKGSENETFIEKTMKASARGLGLKLDDNMSGADRTFFAQQFAEDIGMKGRMDDVLAFMDVLGGPDKKSFLSLAQGKTVGETLDIAKALKAGDKEEAKRLADKKSLEERWIEIGRSLEQVIVDNKGAIIKLAGYVVIGAKAIESLSKVINKWFGRAKNKEIASGVDEMIQRNYPKMDKATREKLISKLFQHKGIDEMSGFAINTEAYGAAGSIMRGRQKAADLSRNKRATVYGFERLPPLPGDMGWNSLTSMDANRGTPVQKDEKPVNVYIKLDNQVLIPGSSSENYYP